MIFTTPVQFLTQSVENQTPDCPSPRGGENCEGCLQPDLELSTGCTTCVEQGPIECTPGEQGCGVRTIDFVKGVGADSQIYHLSGLGLYIERNTVCQILELCIIMPLSHMHVPLHRRRNQGD